MTWSAPDSGQSAITNYNVYNENGGAITSLAVALAYQKTALSNGVLYGFKVTATNAIGASGFSNVMYGVPFGAMSIISAVAVSKTLTLTINPNGKPVERVIMLALDADPTEELVASSIFDIPQNQISQAIVGNITVVKTFTGLSGPITFHLAVAHDNAVVDFIKSP